MEEDKIAEDQLRAAMSSERSDLFEEAGQHALISIAASLRSIATDLAFLAARQQMDVDTLAAQVVQRVMDILSADEADA